MQQKANTLLKSIFTTVDETITSNETKIKETKSEFDQKYLNDVKEMDAKNGGRTSEEIDELRKNINFDKIVTETQFNTNIADYSIDDMVVYSYQY